MRPVSFAAPASSLVPPIPDFLLPRAVFLDQLQHPCVQRDGQPNRQGLAHVPHGRSLVYNLDDDNENRANNGKNSNYNNNHGNGGDSDNNNGHDTDNGGKNNNMIVLLL